MNHCIETIRSIIGRKSHDQRAVFQLGYNLGRLSELTGLGRVPFWDRWKEPVSCWDRAALEVLAQDLPSCLNGEDPSRQKVADSPT